ncbi:hypothetical protein H6G83_25545 [Anabaena azotica FACHB-119]|uniref:CopG-like ribbon-helix-helix domain-containing protein n=1 Tax=Anabaena azotica FACHB-119 TaxID=947527 RepID=A0ABR8DCR0_9NOST|nr:hypothetical protein [Anabaena azotica FACHB-119]
MSENQSQKPKKVTVILPEDIYVKLVSESQQEMRSVSSQAAYILTNYYDNLGKSD